MMPSLQEYENFIYSLQAQFECIKVSTLIVKRASDCSAQVIGELYFDKEVVLRVFEVVDFDDGKIEDYGYEVYHDDENFFGMTVGRIRTIRSWPRLFPTTNTSRLISNTIAFPPKSSVFHNRICPL